MNATYGQIVSAPRAGVARAGMEFHIHRPSGPVEKRPAAPDIEAEKVRGRALLLEPDVYRVDLFDTLRRDRVWSTDWEWED